jgi:hypothetical protein
MAQAAQSTPAQQSDAENMRLAVAQQPTVAGSVAALLQAVVAVIGEALESGDVGKLQGFADKVNADLKSWADAVLANTPSAILTVGPFVGVPSYVQEAFAKHAIDIRELDQRQAQQQQPANKSQEGAQRHS